MTDNPHPNSPRWLRFKSACKYLDIAPSTLAAKLITGSGPRYCVLPGSRYRLFLSSDLDTWILNAPTRPVTPAERERRVKLRLAAGRVRQERRAQRQAKIGKDVTA
jgi:hypothetical protein